MRDALRENVRTGRGGLGNIYVWAAGNGGLNQDNSNYDGYNALPYTISVGALGDDNLKAGYSEPGANLLVVAPSGSRGEGIVTTDNRGASGYSSGDYYDNFNGTSAAAPMVSGVVALMLEANPQLNWREVQVILARSAVPVDFFGSDWVRNGGGRWHSHDYGFGRVDAASATLLASQWRPLGPQREINLPQSTVFTALTNGAELSRSIAVDIPGDLIIEHVLVEVATTHPSWMDLQIELESPGGVRSVLAEAVNASTESNPGSWSYLSTRHLDETANGVWTLRITNTWSTATGIWQNWRLRFYGRTPEGAVNRAPLAEDIIIDSTEFPIVVDALAGVSDPDGDDVSIISLQRPRFGAVTDLGGGRYRFEMGISKDGQDAFGVLLGDGRGNVTRRIITVRDPRPVAVPDRFVVRSGSTHAFAVLANDMDPDGGALRITGVEGSVRGELDVDDGREIRYTAPDGFSGVERFRYAITDDEDGDSSAWVTVVVQATMDVAMEFDGVDDYIAVPGTTAQWLRDRFTAEAWFYAQDYGEYVTGFGRIFDNESFLVFLNGLDHAFYNDRSIVVYMVTEGDGPVAINTPANSVELGQWHHVAVTFDSANSTQPVGIYLDGEPVVAGYPLEATPPLRPVVGSDNFPMLIGESSSGARAFNGKMAELRIWDRVRSAAQIRAAHNIRMNGTEAGLQVYLPFDDIELDQTRNRAGVGFSADIFEARRVPRMAPWSGFEAAFTLSGGSENGWWDDLLLGSIYGDAFPWIYWPSIGWAFAAHRDPQAGYVLHPVAPQRGWLYLAPDTYPWIWHAGRDKWIRLQVTEDGTAWFYQPDSGWWGADEPLPLP
jgi:subtilisin-like proprotein convertase family protein